MPLPREDPTGGRKALILFAATLVVGAALLFVIQPMFAKMVLPLLGGTPATWITCLLFFQAVLLAGYAYAHCTNRWLGARRQAVLHVVLLVVPLVSLPIAVPSDWADRPGQPPWWLLGLLVVAVGLPFFVVSATGPLLQGWFATTSHGRARDPYFLFRASNLGSMLGLLGYPILLEPTVSLARQGRFWAAGYGLLALLILLSAVAVWRAPARVAKPSSPDHTQDIGWRRRLHWVALAFVPSSLMLGVTTYITTDIAAVPLLWVIPLALYLLTFVIAFGRPSPLLSWLMLVLQPLVLLQLLFLVLVRVTEPVALLLVLNLAALFVSALVCHQQLAGDRPPASQLTQFYLWVAVGGVLGGVFNALLAPLIFDSVVEYPLAIALACLLRPRPESDRVWGSWRDVEWAVGLGSATVIVLAAALAAGADTVAARAIVLALALLACLALTDRPLRFGLAVMAVTAVGALPVGDGGETLYRNRTFFGVMRVVADQETRLHRLVHGTTTHGAQSTDPERRREPLAYFHRSGPAGQALTELVAGRPTARVGVVGLGVGSLACYGQPAQLWRFYEIDPEVERIARDPRLFTYLQDCHPRVQVILGDARQSLMREEPGRLDVLVLDAFSSDAIPVHLLTREALRLYRDKLADHGVLAFHITNRYLDLAPVVGDLASDSGLTAFVRRDLDVSDSERDQGKAGSVWVVMARRPADLGSIPDDPRWALLPKRSSPAWTDDFSNIVRVLDLG